MFGTIQQIIQVFFGFSIMGHFLLLIQFCYFLLICSWSPFLHGLLLVKHMSLGICLFILHYNVVSNDLLYFLVQSYFFISNFIYLNLLGHLLSLAKRLSILICLLKEPPLCFIDVIVLFSQSVSLFLQSLFISYHGHIFSCIIP